MKIVAFSDTHGQHEDITFPKGDVIVFAGDMCCWSSFQEVNKFFQFISKLDYKYKLVVGGNHDIPLEKERILIDIPDNVIYLKNNGVEIDGVKFWGSPITPTFFDWAFMKDRGPDIAQHWQTIPNDTDVLITHGPPMDVLDLCKDGHVGCYDLMERIKVVRPKVHIFGHIHEGAGQLEIDETRFINASILDGRYKLKYLPTEIDYEN